MNPFALGALTGSLQGFTPQGQQQQQQVQMNKQALELNQLKIQQERTAMQQQQAERDAMIKAFQGTSNPVDSSGNVNSASGDTFSPVVTKQLDLLYRQGNELYKIGSPKAFEFYKQAEDLKHKATLDATEEQKLKKAKLTEAVQKLNGITDQESYNASILEAVQSGQDPRRIIPGFTGNYEQDKVSIDHLKDTMKTVHEKSMEEEAKRKDEAASKREERIANYQKETLNLSRARLGIEEGRYRLSKEKGGTSPKKDIAEYTKRTDAAYNKYRSEYDRLRSAFDKSTDAEEKKSIKSHMDELNKSYEARRDQMVAAAKAKGIPLKTKDSEPIPKNTSSSVEDDLIKQYSPQ